MATFNDIYQVVLKSQNVAGNQFRNIFHYVPNNTPLNLQEAAEALGEGFSGAQILGFIKDVIYSSVTFYEVVVTDLQDLEVLHVLPLSGVVGQVGGESLPVFCAWTFESEQPAVGVHRAAKRFGPIGENDQSNGAPTPAALIQLNEISAALNTPIVTQAAQGFAGTWTSVVVKRIKEVVGGVVTYRLPGPADIATAYPLDGWVFRTIGSQNSRKVGVGI